MKSDAGDIMRLSAAALAVSYELEVQRPDFRTLLVSGLAVEQVNLIAHALAKAMAQEKPVRLFTGATQAPGQSNQDDSTSIHPLKSLVDVVPSGPVSLRRWLGEQAVDGRALVVTPNLLDDPISLAVAAVADGVLLLVQSGRTTRPMCRQAARVLADVSASLLGVVVVGR